MSTEDEELYSCVGVCMVDEASGLCMGCGKPVLEPAEPEPVKPEVTPLTGACKSPQARCVRACGVGATAAISERNIVVQIGKAAVALGRCAGRGGCGRWP